MRFPAAVTLALLAGNLLVPEGRAANLCSLQWAGSATTLQMANLSSQAAPSELGIGPAATGGMALSADQRHLFWATGDGLAMFDVERLRVVDTLPVNAGRWNLPVAGDLVYFAAPVDGGVVLRVLDVRRRTATDVVDFPDWTQSDNAAIGDSGRLLFLSLRARDGSSGVAAIDLEAARLVAIWTVPPFSSMVVAAAHPSQDVAYLEENIWGGERRMLKWRPGSDPEPLSLPTGSDFVITPDGSRAYVVGHIDFDRPEPTLLIDTSDDSVLAELPSGRIIGFTDAECVILAIGREVRRACPGEASALQIDAATLSRRNLELVASSTHTVTTWTDGPCEMAPAACEDGLPCIEVISATAGAGESVDVEVRLHARGASLAGVQNDLFLQRSLVFPRIGTGRIGSGVPACTVDPEIGKEPTSFSCIETRGDECPATRALVLSLLNVDPIPDESVLYHCEVRVSADASPGRYRIGCGRADGSDPSGTPVAVGCQDGEIIVTAPSNGTRAQSANVASQGCRIDGTGPPSSAVPWLLPVLVMLGWRVTRRR